MRLSVGPYEAVDVELGIVHRVPKVASVPPGLDGVAGGILDFMQQALVHPIPDEASLQDPTCVSMRMLLAMRWLLASYRSGPGHCWLWAE